MSTLAWKLTDDERTELFENEAVVRNFFADAPRAGAALKNIRDKKLYREHSETFVDYLRDMWGVSESRGYQLMDVAKVSENIKTSTIVEVPVLESHYRELAKAPAEKQAEVWQLAVESAPDGGVTAQHLRNTVRPYRGDVYPKPVEPVKKGFPSEGSRRAAIELILKTREPRGTIAKFLGVHDSLVSNLVYLDVPTRSTLDEQREQAYLEAGRLTGRTPAEVRQWLAGQQKEVV